MSHQTVTPEAENLPAETRLMKRPGSRMFYFRAKVPVDLLDHYQPAKEITRSLKTSDPREAVRRVRIMSVEVDAEFACIRKARAASGGEPLDTISDKEAERLAAKWMAQVLEEDEEVRREGLDERGFRKAAEALDIVDAGGRFDLARGDTKVVDFEVEDFVEVEGLPIRRGSDAFRRLAYAFMKASVKATEMMLARQRGEVVETPAPPPAGPEQSELLSVVFAGWKAERKPPRQTLLDFSTAVRRFTDLHGDMPVAMIGQEHVRRFKEALMRLPRGLKHELRGLALPKVLALVGDVPEEKRLAAGSINKSVGCLHTVLEWGFDNGYCAAVPGWRNPARKMKVSDQRAENGDGRLPFELADLKAIFGSPIYTAGKRPTGGKGEAAKWLPLLGLFTGARLEELGQALVSDVRCEDGVHYLDLNTFGRKRLKNRNSRRKVPLHPELRRLGFLAYVAGLPEHGPLFPDLPEGDIYKRTKAWSQWFGRWLTSLGITDERKVFHSFRHGFKDACRSARIPEEVHDALTGHSNGGVGRDYGHGMKSLLEVLADELARLRFPGLDLSPLYLAEPDA